MKSYLSIDSRLSGEVTRPSELLAWSKTHDGDIYYDDRLLRYYHFPPSDLKRDISLTCGFGPSVFNPNASSEDSGHSKFDRDAPKPRIADQKSKYLDSVLDAVMKVEQDMGHKVKADIITWRGNLTDLAVLGKKKMWGPVVMYPPSEFFVTGFDGQIFMVSDPDSKTDRLPEFPTYAGYQFEWVTTLAKPVQYTAKSERDSRCETGHLDKALGSYYTLLRGEVGEVDVVYGAEIDCALDPGSQKLTYSKARPRHDGRGYIELKTSVVPNTWYKRKFFPKKLLRTWVQSVLGACDYIIYGFRDEQFRLVSLQEMPTDDVPRIVSLSGQDKSRSWNRVDVMRFYVVVLQWIRENVKDNQSYSIKFEEQSCCLVIEERDVAIEGREVAFLSNRFVEWRRSLKATRVGTEMSTNEATRVETEMSTNEATRVETEMSTNEAARPVEAPTNEAQLANSSLDSTGRETYHENLEPAANEVLGECVPSLQETGEKDSLVTQVKPSLDSTEKSERIVSEVPIESETPNEIRDEKSDEGAGGKKTSSETHGGQVARLSLDSNPGIPQHETPSCETSDHETPDSAPNVNRRTSIISHSSTSETTVGLNRLPTSGPNTRLIHGTPKLTKSDN